MILRGDEAIGSSPSVARGQCCTFVRDEVLGGLDCPVRSHLRGAEMGWMSRELIHPRPVSRAGFRKALSKGNARRYRGGPRRFACLRFQGAGPLGSQRQVLRLRKYQQASLLPRLLVAKFPVQAGFQYRSLRQQRWGHRPERRSLARVPGCREGQPRHR